MKWIYAKLNLAFALFMHLVWKRWTNYRGANVFLSLYKEDRILHLTSKSRQTFIPHQNCINCGLCVVQCEVTSESFYQTFMTPAHMIFSYSRSLPELFLNKDFLKYCTSCRGCEKVCPTEVPLTHVIEFVREMTEKKI